MSLFRYICSSGRVAPDYEGLEVGVGESTLIKVMVDVYGRSEPSIKNGNTMSTESDSSFQYQW